MQNYLELQNKLRRELSERWNQYYQVDGLAKQKGNNIRFTPTTALQGIMFQVTKELQDLENVLTQKNSGETPAQALARQKMIVNEKIPKLIEQHKQASTNGIIGKEEAWEKLLKKYPELNAFVKKYGKARANEAILNSMSPNINDYETNVAKANLAKEYQTSEFNDIVKFLRQQEEEIKQRNKQKQADDNLENAMQAYALMENRNSQKRNAIKDKEQLLALRDKQNEPRDFADALGLPLVPYYDDDEEEEDDNDDVETVAQREKKKSKKPSQKSPTRTPPPKASFKQSNAGKKIYVSKTPDDSDDERRMKNERRNANDDDDDYEPVQLRPYEKAKIIKEVKDKLDEERAIELGFSSVKEMKKEQQRINNINKGKDRYATMTADERQKLRDYQNAKNAEKRKNALNAAKASEISGKKNAERNSSAKPKPKVNSKQANQYRNKDPFFDYDDEWENGTPEEGFFYENEAVRPLKPLDIDTYVPNVVKNASKQSKELKQHSEKQLKKAQEALGKVKETPYGLDDVDEYVYRNPNVKNPLETMEGLGKRGKRGTQSMRAKSASLGKGKKPEPMKTKPKPKTPASNNNHDTQQTKHVSFPQLPPGVQNH